MLSRNFGSMFDNDPFFAGHESHMREMDKFFRDSDKFFRDPFQGPGGPLSIEDSRGGGRRRGAEEERGNRELIPRSLFEGFDSMFRGMQDMMQNMHSNFEQAAKDPNSQMISHSSFASYSNTKGSEPKVFQATSSTRQAGGLRETRKTLRDSESKKEKMAIGRYIGDKGHVIQRERMSGSEQENQEYINMGEDEAGQFDREWKDQTQRYADRPIDRGRLDRGERRPRALPPSRDHGRRDKY